MNDDPTFVTFGSPIVVVPFPLAPEADNTTLRLPAATV
jgi:hypothetical protein